MPASSGGRGRGGGVKLQLFSFKWSNGLILLKLNFSIS